MALVPRPVGSLELTRQPLYATCAGLCRRRGVWHSAQSLKIHHDLTDVSLAFLVAKGAGQFLQGIVAVDHRF